MLVKRMIWRLLGLIFSAALIFLLVNSLMYIYKLHVITSIIWSSVVQLDAFWLSIIWSGVIWSDVVWSSVIWLDVIWSMVFGRKSLGQRVFTCHLSNSNSDPLLLTPFFRNNFNNYVTNLVLSLKQRRMFSENYVFWKLPKKFSTHYHKRWCPTPFYLSTISTFNNAISHQIVFSPTTPNFYKVKYSEYFL